MEPVSAVLGAVVAAVLGGAAGEAGKRAWSGLVDLVRTRFGGESPVTGAVERAGADAAEQVTGMLVGASAADAGFARQLHGWVERHRSLAAGGGGVTNTVAGGASVHGPVIQARDIGSVTFGPPRHDR